MTEILQMRSVASIEQRLSGLLSAKGSSRRELDEELKEAGFRLVRNGDRCDSYSYDEDHDRQAPLEYTLSVRVEWCAADTRVRAWYTGL